jgi:ubiquitin C-terminal hydrolase
MRENQQIQGLSGLANLGNTCFINSILQILSHTHILNDVLNNENTITNEKNQQEVSLLIEWNNLRKLMWSQNCIISPKRFINHLQSVAIYKNREEYSQVGQNDSSEFFLFLIDCFHQALSREVTIDIDGNPKNDKDVLAIICYNKIKEIYDKDYSDIYNIFSGIHVSQIISLQDGTVLSNTPELFSIISLPIPQDIKQPSIYDCLDLYLKGEILEGENAWYNEKTHSKESIQKRIIYWSLPKILVLDIKRFYSENLNKNNINISFPIDTLDLTKYVHGYCPNKYIYDLYAICNHIGGLFSGHYYSFIKISNKWFCFNDNNISEITHLPQLISPNAYMFFYKMRE